MITRQEAIKKLEETNELTTGMLEPLNIDMDSFLRFAQASKQARERVIKQLIQYYREVK